MQIDGSTVQEPGAKETTNRVHLALDVGQMRLIEAKITTDKVGESFDHFEQLRSGDVVIADRGYNQPSMLVRTIARGVDFVIRYNAHGMNLWKRKENQEVAVGKLEKEEWMPLLKANEGKAFCQPVFVAHESTAIPCYLHAIPLPKEQADKAKQKIRDKAKKNGRTAGQNAVYTSGWVLILTSVPPSVLPTLVIAELYRTRWQIELMIKRLKSIINMDKLRSFKGSKMTDLYLHAKLLYAVIIEKITQSRFSGAKYQFDENREITMWRLMTDVHEKIKAGISQAFPIGEKFTPAMIKSMTERKRKRELQKPPEQVQDLINWCRKNGFSAV